MTQQSTAAALGSSAPAVADRFIVPLFSFALFLSAVIMFALEPMTGKMLLPLVGGTPAGWIVAMAFFQIMLLAGYFLAHLLARFSPRNHALIYIVVLGLGIVLLPPHLKEIHSNGTPGPLDIFVLLCRSIALPFIALSAGSSTLQRLFTTARHGRASDPYFLYAASNLGSFTGLLLYPFAIEPYTGLLNQSHKWTLGYGLLILLSLACLFICRKASVEETPKNVDEAAPTLKTSLHWLALAFVPSSLMLGVTTQITSDIFSAPMLWVLPLGLYLLTFVIAFGHRQYALMQLIPTTQHVLVAIAVTALFLPLHGLNLSWKMMGLQLLCFTWVALACHMQLAKLRPQNSQKHLTHFYLMMALGGALGGMMNAFLIPLITDMLLEYPVVLTLSLLLNPLFYKKFDKQDRIFFGLSLLMAAIFGTILVTLLSLPMALKGSALIVTLVYFLYFYFITTHVRTTFVNALILLLIIQCAPIKGHLTTVRNFYGIVKVTERTVTVDNKPYTARYMYHGTTVHGVEIMDPAYVKKPLGYYGDGSGIERIFHLYKPKDTLVMGLGTGQLNCYSTPKSSMTMIDIDPAVIKMAQQQFNYLSSCQGRLPTKLILGDARMELGKLKGQKFDLIVMDAFTGDGIPVHLLTMEALMEDVTHLKKGGLIIANVSNRYINLVPVLSATARFLGLNTRFSLHIIKQSSFYNFPSVWIVIAPPTTSLARLDSDKKAKWITLPPNPNQRIWTDDYSSLLNALSVSIPFIHQKKTLFN